MGILEPRGAFGATIPRLLPGIHRSRRGGRKSDEERSPEMVARAKKLARYPVQGRKRSLRAVAAKLAAAFGGPGNGGINVYRRVPLRPILIVV